MCRAAWETGDGLVRMGCIGGWLWLESKASCACLAFSVEDIVWYLKSPGTASKARICTYVVKSRLWDIVRVALEESSQRQKTGAVNKVACFPAPNKICMCARITSMYARTNYTQYIYLAPLPPFALPFPFFFFSSLCLLA